jgi:hypothetical protein
MSGDQRTLNMAAAGLSLAAALLALVAGRRDGVARLSGVIAVLGSAAWAAAAYQDLCDTGSA